LIGIERDLSAARVGAWIETAIRQRHPSLPARRFLWLFGSNNQSSIESLSVVFQEVVDIEAGSADGRQLIQASMRTVPVVQPGYKTPIKLAIKK
jgi:hypothetical protein